MNKTSQPRKIQHNQSQKFFFLFLNNGIVGRIGHSISSCVCDRRRALHADWYRLISAQHNQRAETFLLIFTPLCLKCSTNNHHNIIRGSISSPALCLKYIGLWVHPGSSEDCRHFVALTRRPRAIHSNLPAAPRAQPLCVCYGRHL